MTVRSTEESLCNYMFALDTFICRVLTALRRVSRQHSYASEA
jgi:hypothetical protein